MTINTLFNRVKSLDINKISVDSLTETSEARATANREQMSRGLNSTGSIIGIYKSRQYAAFKQAIGSQADFGVVDLKLTKAFQTKLKSDVRGNIINYESTDEKMQKLVDNYGDVIFGLSTMYKVDYIAKDLRPVFNGKIEAVTGLKITK